MFRVNDLNLVLRGSSSIVSFHVMWCMLLVGRRCYNSGQCIWCLCGRCKQNVHSKDVSCDKACDKCLHAEHTGSVCEECRATGIPGKAKCNARCAIPVCRHRGNRAPHRKNGCGECDPGKGCSAIAAGAKNDASVNTGDSIVIPGGGDDTGDSRNGGADARLRQMNH